MPNVVRFTLPTARELYVSGVGAFHAGVLDVDANDLDRVSRARYRTDPYGAIEVGVVPEGTAFPSLPAVPGPAAPDPYPMYATSTDLIRLLADSPIRSLPRVMTTPPTVTVTNDTAPATTMTSVRTLSGVSYTSIVCDDLTKYLPLGAGTSQPVRGNDGGVQDFACGWHPTVNGPQVVRLEFLFDGAEFEVCLRQFAGVQFRIMVDGEYASRYPQSLGGTANAWGNVKVLFSGRAVRRIVFEVYGTGTLFLGVWLHINDTMRAPAAPARRLLVAGDSYAGGAVASPLASFPIYYGQALGFRDIVNSGVGSTGWIADGSYSDVLTRLTTDVITPAPTDVVFALGHNDTGFSNSAITTQVQAVLAATRAALPYLETLVVTGPLFAGGSPGVYAAMNDAIESGCVASGATFIDTVGNPIFTGTGRVGATTGDGNSDLYIGSDGTHPTDAGSAWLGYVLAQSVIDTLS